MLLALSVMFAFSKPCLAKIVHSCGNHLFCAALVMATAMSVQWVGLAINWRVDHRFASIRTTKTTVPVCYAYFDLLFPNLLK